MARIFVKPKAGSSPRDPMNPGVRIPEDGDWREDATAYRRLERTGDVTISNGPSVAQSAETPKPKK